MIAKILYQFPQKVTLLQGKGQQNSPLPKLRPSHFPANAFLTDRSLRVRSFQIETAPAAKRFE
jgi:hypothetical protein